MNSNTTIINNVENFELREKRLKRVYGVAYVVAAIFLAVFTNVIAGRITQNTVPIYSFALATSSLFLIQAIKYALLEFRCMPISRTVDIKLSEQTEAAYDGVWKLLTPSLSASAIFMSLHLLWPHIFATDVLEVVLLVCVSFCAVLSIVDLFKSHFNDAWLKAFYIIDCFLSPITAYFVCAILCSLSVDVVA